MISGKIHKLTVSYGPVLYSLKIDEKQWWITYEEHNLEIHVNAPTLDEALQRIENPRVETAIFNALIGKVIE